MDVGNVSSGSGLVNVDVIVLDEVHYLSDISHGTVWEEIIHGETELVTSSKRPVPLTWHFSLKNSLSPLLNEKGTHMNRKLSLNYLQLQAAAAKPYKDDWSRKRNSQKRGTHSGYDSDDNMFEQRSLSKNNINAIRHSQVPRVIDTLWQLQSRDMLPAIWFIFSRKGCDAAVLYLENCKLLDECETSEVELAFKRFRKLYPDAVRESAVRGLLQGVAAHHAGCLPLWKAFIEELFQRGLVKVVFATETLAAGINMPARTAVISSLSKRSDSGRITLSSNELLQMAGRAGRRGIDEIGHVVLIQTPNEGAEEGCKVLFAGLEPLVSQFTASYGMVLNLLAGGKPWKTAAAIRGENELWLAMVLCSKILLELKPAQLAAVCASLVSAGIKVRPGKNNSYIYKPSATVTKFITFVVWLRPGLLGCAMDDGDLARLLRRTIDLLVQIPKLPDIDPLLNLSGNLFASVERSSVDFVFINFQPCFYDMIIIVILLLTKI
ncbi:DExH-box ATP-dependent RNA helicase DExH15 chloroplastic [Glycine soja]